MLNANSEQNFIVPFPSVHYRIWNSNENCSVCINYLNEIGKKLKNEERKEEKQTINSVAAEGMNYRHVMLKSVWVLKFNQ